MKKLLLALACTVLSSSVFALSLGDFVGKYSIDKKNCTSPLKEYSRVYVQILTDKKSGDKTLMVRAYGDEATMSTYKLGSGTSSNAVTGATASWNTRFENGVLTSETIYKDKSGKVHSGEKTVMVKDSGNLKIAERVFSLTGKPIDTLCVLSEISL